MKAIGLTQKAKIGNVPNEIKELNIPIPKIKNDEVLVKIYASAFHVDEIWMTQGTAMGRFFGPKKVSKENPYIMGTTFSGVIVKKGIEVKEFNIGDEVISIPNERGEDSSWAEYRKIDQMHIMSKPKELSHKAAAATIVAGSMAFSVLLYSKTKKGDQCLVLGASGGIGMVLVQMLKAKGAFVTGVCSTRNIEAVKANGADAVIDYKKAQFQEQLLQKDKKMDVVFDCVGGRQYEKDSLQILNKNGKYITLCGPERYIGSKKLSWGRVISIIWYVFRRSIISRIRGPRYIFPLKYPSSIIRDMFEFVLSNKIKVPYDSVVSFNQKEISEALKRLADHKATGRIVLEIATG